MGRTVYRSIIIILVDKGIAVRIIEITRHGPALILHPDHIERDTDTDPLQAIDIGIIRNAN